MFAALAPAVAALLPSVTVGGVGWTGVSLAANTVFASYLGIAQGTSRFVTMTALYLTAHSTRLAIGAVGAAAQVSPTTVMAAQTAAWALAAVAGRLLLRDEARVSPRDEAPLSPPDGRPVGEAAIDTAALNGGYLLGDAQELAAGRAPAPRPATPKPPATPNRSRTPAATSPKYCARPAAWAASCC